MYKVLIADDERMIRTGIVKLVDWKALSCQVVHESEDGIDAYQFLRDNEVDIAILDIRMPGMSGLELAKRLQSEKHAPKIILLTAYSDFGYVQTALRAGVEDYIVKASFEIELPQAVSKALSNAADEQRKEDDIPPENSLQASRTAMLISSYLKQNYTQRITLEQLARHFHLSKGHMGRIYKQHTGFSIIEDLLNIRIARAKELLLLGISVAETAQRTGFSDAVHFTHLFTEKTGMSPRDFKKDKT